MADQTELDQDFKCSACKIQKHYSSFVLSLGSLPKVVLVDVGSTHYGPIFWQTLGKNPILVGYVVLGIGSVAWLSVYLKVSGYYNHIKDHLIANPISKSQVSQWLLQSYKRSFDCKTQYPRVK